MCDLKSLSSAIAQEAKGSSSGAGSSFPVPRREGGWLCVGMPDTFCGTFCVFSYSLWILFCFIPTYNKTQLRATIIPLLHYSLLLFSSFSLQLCSRQKVSTEPISISWAIQKLNPDTWREGLEVGDTNLTGKTLRNFPHQNFLKVFMEYAEKWIILYISASHFSAICCLHLGISRSFPSSLPV
jgi:hypothetical protein